MGEWKQRAADFGFDLGDLTRVVGLGRPADQAAAIDPDLVRTGLEELSGRRRTIAHRDVVAVIAAASPGGMRSQVVEAAATRVVEAAGAPLSAPDPAARSDSPPGALRRGSGPVECRWATLDVAHAVERGIGEVVAVAVDPGRAAADSRHPDRQRTGPDRHVTRMLPLGAIRGLADVRLGR